MKNTFKVLITFFIPILFFIGCEDKPLPFEPQYNTNENITLSKTGVVESAFGTDKQASKQASKLIKQTLNP